MQYFEQRLEEENIKSKKIAWMVAGLMCVICLLLTFTIFHLAPLKQTEVKLLVVDKNTGYPTDLTRLASFETNNVRSITAKEALNKYFTQLYILAHDGYNHYTVNDTYALVKLYSTPEVFQQFRNKFLPPNELHKKMGKNRRVEVKILSMQPQGTTTPFKKENDGVMMRARVERIIMGSDNIPIDTRTGTITMTFGYDSSLQMDERARNLNPLGFTVTSYRFDLDQIKEGEKS